MLDGSFTRYSLGVDRRRSIDATVQPLEAAGGACAACRVEVAVGVLLVVKVFAMRTSIVREIVLSQSYAARRTA